MPDLLRDVQYAIDCGDAVFAPALSDLLTWTIAVGRRRDGLSGSALQQCRTKADRRLDRLLAAPAPYAAGCDLQAQVKAAALRRITDRIPRLRAEGVRISEQDTKRILITLAVEALGWDILSIDEIGNECRHYSARVLPEPRLSALYAHEVNGAPPYGALAMAKVD